MEERLETCSREVSQAGVSPIGAIKQFFHHKKTSLRFQMDLFSCPAVSSPGNGSGGTFHVFHSSRPTNVVARFYVHKSARARVSVLFCQRAGLLGVGVGPPTAGISVKAVAAAVAVTGKRPTMIIFPSRHCVTLTFQLSLSISRSLLLLSVHFIVRFG